MGILYPFALKGIIIITCDNGVLTVKSSQGPPTPLFGIRFISARLVRLCGTPFHTFFKNPFQIGSLLGFAFAFQIFNNVFDILLVRDNIC